MPTANSYRALEPQEAWNEMGNMEAYFRQMSQVARPGHQLHHLNPTCGQPNQIPDNRPINRLLNVREIIWPLTTLTTLTT